MPNINFNTDTVYRFSRHSPEYGIFIASEEVKIHVFGKAHADIHTVYTFLLGHNLKFYAKNPDPESDGFAIVDFKKGKYVLNVIESFKGPVYITET